MIRMAKMGLPPRLGSTQLDPVTGHIEYPLALTAARRRPVGKDPVELISIRRKLLGCQRHGIFNVTGDRVELRGTKPGWHAHFGHSDRLFMSDVRPSLGRLSLTVRLPHLKVGFGPSQPVLDLLGLGLLPVLRGGGVIKILGTLSPHLF
jgi:hypothetical protein